MKILVTNDDGWQFVGMHTLARLAAEFGEVWTVAPKDPMSGVSHRITFEQPMSFEKRGDRCYSVSGTPADCVRVAMSQLDVDFDWVLSGINNGSNLGVDVFISGTVAAAREATFFGHRAIALSQYLKGFRQNFDWEQAASLTRRILQQLFESDLKGGEFFNVNLPDTEGGPVDQLELSYTELDRNPLPAKFKAINETDLLYCGKYKERQRDRGLDSDTCFRGHVSITRHRPE